MKRFLKIVIYNFFPMEEVDGYMIPNWLYRALS